MVRRRRVPSVLLPYLGEYTERPAEESIPSQLGQARIEGDDWRIIEFDPLAIVMDLVTEEVRALRLSPRGPRGSRVWISAMESLQDDVGILEQNRFIPCRTCNRAFLPTIDRHLIELFLSWEESGELDDFLAIHRCQRCGGTITELDSEEYEGDLHTPEPGEIDDDWEWACSLTRHSGLFEERVAEARSKRREADPRFDAKQECTRPL
jgi:hypothetical protein